MSGSAAATNGWITFYPVHQPVTLELPDSWTATPPSGAGDTFDAQTGNASADMEIAVSPYRGSWSQFVRVERSNARQAYLTQDPNAHFRLGVVEMPAGRAFHASVRLVRRSSGGRLYHLSLEDWVFLRHGRGYEFVYSAFVVPAQSLVAVFERSARSIRFK